MKFSPVNIESRRNLDMRSGDTVRVWQKIQEKGKTRLQAFEGLVIARKHGRETGATFTVRKVASGVGVEKIFPLYSPLIDKVETIRRSKTRRSKLYFIRNKSVKNIRRKMQNLGAFVPVSSDEQTVAEIREGVSEETSESTKEGGVVEAKKETETKTKKEKAEKKEKAS